MDFYSAHVENTHRLKKLLYICLLKTRLPESEKLEGLRLLKAAWDVVDIGQNNINFFNFWAKFIHLFMVAFFVATVCFIVFTDYIDPAITVTDFDYNLMPTGSLFFLCVASIFATALSA